MTKTDLYLASDKNDTGYKRTKVPDEGVVAYEKESCWNTRGVFHFARPVRYRDLYEINWDV
jgi:hypothetical protein